MSSSSTCEECKAPIQNRFCTNCGAENKNYGTSHSNVTMLYERTLYPYCIFSALCCRTVRLQITNKRVDTGHGCCQGQLDTLDLRRITDIEFDRSCIAMCCNRGTITIHASDETSPVTKITCFGAKRVFNALREAWQKTKLTTIVQ
eukprot:m.7787 g.7787  ORF g.7787 m.7787 type:complete len:146 (+) comp8934_c1_seq1:77-514(+)